MPHGRGQKMPSGLLDGQAKQLREMCSLKTPGE
jgi:hypothetical protein